MILATFLLLPLALQAPAAPSRATDARPAQRAELLAGLTALEPVGVPGTLSVFGPDAFAVAIGAGERGLALVAAGERAGAGGRVVALAHDGYLAFDGDARPNAARLAENALRWLARDAERPTVGILGRDRGLTEALAARGHAVRGPDAPFPCDVVVWRGGWDLRAEELGALGVHLDGGGGLLCAVCPWGWDQVHPARGLDSLQPNDVLTPFGLAFASATSSPGAGGVFELVDTSALDAVNAWDALQSLDGGATPPRIDAIEHALRAAPADAAFHALALDVLGRAFDVDGVPRPDRPLRASDARARLAVTRGFLSMRSAARAPGDADAVPVAPGAEAFPGAVPSDAPRVSRALRLAPTPPGRRSTGLYLPPGGVVRVDDAEGWEGWRLRVGAHSDRLWHKDEWRRWPEITDEVPLAGSTTSLGSAFGGAVYLIPPADGAGELRATVRGCVRAPLYTLGSDDSLAAWRKARLAPGPWAELVGRHVALSVPSEAVRGLDDPRALLEFWDAALVGHCELGAEPVPARPERFVADVQISAGYMHSGYPIMTWLDVVTPDADGAPALQLDLDRLLREGSWGHFHELGHNRQKNAWTFRGTGEVTCNLFSLHAAERLCGIEPWEHPWLANQKDAARAYLEAPDFEGVWRKKPGVALMTYAELQRKFGWAPFTAAFAAYQDAPAPRGDAEQIATWIRRISIACERDLRPFHARWGWPIDAELAGDAELSALAPWEGGDVRGW